MLHKPYRFPTDELFDEACVLDPRQLYVKDILTYFYKHRQDLPGLTREHDHNTRHRDQLLLPRLNLTMGQRHYTYLAPKMYNLLPTNVKSCYSLKKFKHNLSQWLITKRQEIDQLLFD